MCIKMRLLIIIFFFSLNASATNYYVSNLGSDGANGLTTGTSWQTISKINGFNFTAGDSIFLNKNNSWNERLNPPRSNIYFGTYGTGNKPLITGFQSLTLTNQGSNIWSATAANSVKKQNTIVVNGLISAKARFPKTGYLYSSNSGTNQNRLVVTGLTGSYTGAELVARGYFWIIDVNTVRSQLVDTLNISPSFTYAINGYSYFFQNLPSYCTLQNEWAYDSTSKLLTVYSVGMPTIKYSTIDTLVFMNNKSYITFDGLKFDGSNLIALDADTSSHITIKNCAFDNNGRTTIYGQMSTYAVIKNDSLQNSLSNAIFIVRGCDNDSVYNNYVKNIGVFAGMGESGNGTYQGTYIQGLNSYIVHNEFDSVGYAAIVFNGTNSLVYRNYIKNCCFVKSDGAGIYTFDAAGSIAGSLIRSNIILNGVDGVSNDMAAGIYLDNNSQGATVDSNTIQKATLYAFFLNYANNIEIHNNIIDDSLGIPFGLQGGINIKFTKNILYSRSSSQYIFHINSSTSLLAMDSNTYLRPIAEVNKIYGVKINTALTDFQQWKDSTGFDNNSISTLTGVTSAPGVLYFNATLAPVTKTFIGTYKDTKGVYYTNSIVLQPFASAILFYATAQTINYGNKLRGLIFKRIKV